MFNLNTFARIKASLQDSVPRKNFTLHYSRANPSSGRSAGRHGVRRPELPMLYVQSLERTYRTLLEMGWQAPSLEKSSPTDVYLFEIADMINAEAFMFYENESPFLALPSRPESHRPHDPCQFAAIVAIHETTHLFNNTYRSWYTAGSQAEEWRWLDEATAVYLERLVAPWNPSSVRMFREWIDEPELSLDSVDGAYGQALFVEYICQTFGTGLLRDIWTPSSPGESPLQAFARLMPQAPTQSAGRAFASANPGNLGFFFAGYCVDSYFVWRLAPDVYTCHGGRNVTETYFASPGSMVELESVDYLDHLACRYYRFYPVGQANELTFTFLADSNQPGANDLSVSLLPVTPALEAGPLVPLSLGRSGAQMQFTGTLDNFQAREIDHAVLVVANCGVVDGVEYRFRAQAT